MRGQGCACSLKTNFIYFLASWQIAQNLSPPTEKYAIYVTIIPRVVGRRERDRQNGRTVTWAMAVLMENKFTRQFKTWKQAQKNKGQKNKKPSRLSYLEPPSWSSGLVGHINSGFISECGKITAKNVMNYKVKREGKGEKSEEQHH